MWLLLGIMGALMASTVIDFQPRAANGVAADDDDSAQPPEDPWLDNPNDDLFISNDLMLGGDEPDDEEPVDEDPGDDHLSGDDPDAEVPPVDPWLDGWVDDEFISTDASHGSDDEDEDHDDDTVDNDGDEGPEDDPLAERPPPDPWLDEWVDDEFISSDMDEVAARTEASRVIGSGERVLAGDGGVFVLGEWVDADDPIIFADFRPDEDRLVYAHVAADGPPDMSLATLPETGSAGLLVNGELVVRFEGGTPPAIEAVQLMPVDIDTQPPLTT